MLGKTNASVGGKVNNQDIYVTDNGTYTAGEGFSGLGVVEVNVPKGEQVTAINKTGSLITTGQKLWLNENVQSANTSYQMPYIGSNKGCFICRTGTYGYASNSTYSLTDTTATKQVSISADYWNKLRYADNGAMFVSKDATCWRIDEQAQYTINFIPIGGDMFMNNYGEYKRLDITNGTVIENLPQFTNFPDTRVLFVEDSSVCISYRQRAFYNREENKWVTYGINVANHDGSLNTIAMTLDNKYMLCSDGYNYSSTNDSGWGLRLIERIDPDNYRVLLQSEMPEDLQDFYTGSSITFNPYTGILTAAKQKSTNYVVMRYENGTWTKVPVDLSGFLGDTNFFRGPLTVSDDLTRACATYSVGASSSAIYGQIINLVDTSGYVAIPYKSYNVTENTQTGYAGNDAESGSEVIVGIGSVPSVPSVDDGGNGGDVSVPYEINYDNVTVVNDSGSLYINQNDKGSYTVISGFDGNSTGFWFNNAPAFGLDHSYTYQFKFKLEDGNVNSLLGTYALGNFQDESFINPSIRFNLEHNPDTNSDDLIIELVGRTDVLYRTTLYAPDLVNRWVTVEVKVDSDDARWHIYSDGPVISYEDKATGEAELISFPLNYYLIFTNNEGRVPASLSVDLEETGFKQNGEWVYRAVKPI